MKNIKTGIFCALIIATTTRCSMGGEAVDALLKGLDKNVTDLVQVAGSLGDKGNIVTTFVDGAPGGLGDVRKAITVVAEVGVVAYRVTQIYSIGKEVTSCLYPKILSAKRIESAQEDLELLRTRKSFSQCLVNNRLSTEKLESKHA